MQQNPCLDRKAPTKPISAPQRLCMRQALSLENWGLSEQGNLN